MSSQDSRGGAATSLRDRRVARVIDREIAPIWHDRFARLIIRNLPSNLPNADVTALDIHCGVGRTTAELLGRLGSSARVLALEPDDILLDLARTRMRPEWKNRVYFKAGNFDDVTSMADDAYNLVVANLVLGETGDIPNALGEMLRVNRIGGRVLATLPLADSWHEVEDIFSEVLRDAGLHAAVRRLDRLRQLRPTGPALADIVRQQGVAEDDFVIEQERFHMLFPSGREFLFAPVVEHGPLRLWKAVIGKDGTPQELFWRLKEAIDTYYTGHVLAVNVLAGLVNVHVAKGTESPGPRLAARHWRHYPTLDALWGGLAAGYVKISEGPAFTDADLDFDLEIDEGERRTGAQKAVTTSISIITEDIADEPELPFEPLKPKQREPSGAKSPAVTTKPAEPSGPKKPVSPAKPKQTDDFDAAFAEYEPDAPAKHTKPAELAKPVEPAPEPEPTPEPEPVAAEPTRRTEPPSFRLPSSESGRFKPPTAAEPNATSEPDKPREPSGATELKFRPPGAQDSSSGLRRPVGEPSGVRPVSESSGLRPLGEPSGTTARPMAEPSGTMPRPTGDSSGFFRPPARPSSDPVTNTGSFKVFAPPKPRLSQEPGREQGAPSSARIRRNSQPLGLADVPKSLADALDADPATERAFDRLTLDEPAPTRSRPQPADSKPKSLMAELEADDLGTPGDGAPLALSLTAEPIAEPKPEQPEPEATMPDPKRTSMADLEANTTPPEELDELDDAEAMEEVEEEALTVTRPGPPPMRPAKSPPPPPTGAFKPRPLMPILPPKKK